MTCVSGEVECIVDRFDNSEISSRATMPAVREVYGQVSDVLLVSIRFRVGSCVRHSLNNFCERPPNDLD